ncbi:hypothetical protein TNCV_4620631 [Trichonephila clavipes]|nr:hypothetical protein TNCV_4620631 [Trichonephila clavipes]
MTPELTSSSLHYHTNGRTLSLGRFNMHRYPLFGGSSMVLGSNSWHAGHDPVAITTRLPQPLSAAVSVGGRTLQDN